MSSMRLLPIGVGDRDEQEFFLREYTPFLEHYPDLNRVAEKVCCRTLNSPPQAEVDRLLAVQSSLKRSPKLGSWDRNST